MIQDQLQHFLNQQRGSLSGTRKVAQVPDFHMVQQPVQQMVSQPVQLNLNSIQNNSTPQMVSIGNLNQVQHSPIVVPTSTGSRSAGQLVVCNTPSGIVCVPISSLVTGCGGGGNVSNTGFGGSVANQMC